MAKSWQQTDDCVQAAMQARLRLAAIVESSEDAIIGTDMNGIVMEWNNAAARLYGYSADEIRGKPVSLLVPQDRPDEAGETLRNIRNGSTVKHFETVRQKKDGTLIEVSLTVFPIFDTEGRVIGASGIVRDISERKRQDAVLRESEERFRLAMGNVPSGLYTLDQQGLVTYVNPAAEAMFGWTSAELLGKKMHDVIHYKHPDGSPFPACECPGHQALVKGIELREHEDMFIRKDGSFFPLVYSASPLKKDGQTIGVVVGFRDDTQRRKAEQAIRESEERFRLVANTAPVMIWTSGLDKLCNYFNQGWLEFTGRALEEELGNGWAKRVHSEDLKRCMETYATAFDRREPFRMEYRLLRHDGEYRWILDSGMPRYNADGSFAGYIGSCIDVSERKLAEEALASVSRKLLEAHEQERTLIARELHDDIGQQLALLSVEIQQMKKSLPSSDGELQSQMDALNNRASEISTDIQSLSHQLHSSKLEYLGVTFAMKSFCKEFGEKHNVRINLRSNGVPPDVPQQVALCLFRVMQEGLRNALKHSGVRFFEVNLHGSAGDIHLTVRDSGVGFDPELATATQGLGLTSMQERVRLLKGTISITSRPQSGTEIRVSIPLGAWTQTEQTKSAWA